MAARSIYITFTFTLKEHKSLGLLRVHNDDNYTAMADAAEGRSRLIHLGEDAKTGKGSELES